MFDFSSALFWVSLGEYLLFIFSILIFFADASEMSGIWLHIFHAGRGLLGGLIVRKMPTYHQMVEAIPSHGQKKIPFSDISKVVEEGARECVVKFEEAMGSLIKIYVLTSFVCTIFDIIQFFVGVSKYGNDD